MNILSALRKWLWGRDRRRHYRFDRPPVTLIIDGMDYRTVDWSLGGFRIHAEGKAFDHGNRLEGVIKLPSGGDGTFSAEVIGRTPQGDVRLRLMEITPAVFVAMSNLEG